ncbi:PREDICTED: probable protein phosphatase 2C 65 [Ipomoea nil]|uniref:probable protein phosphatase 2C 65 n=1 Tax=Ipomoea nil TaxID=35883 RepID=UPI000901CF9B|nr:PREDICTED: probable protein phosphatase 2C 65 [Ipomoea nil]
MGGCITCQRCGIDKRNGCGVGNLGGLRGVVDRNVEDGEYDGVTARGDYDARVRLHGSSAFTSMYSKQGRKGINQDAMTVWENFTGQQGAYFCGVFDGHGPYGHKVSRFVRDTLPSKLSLSMKLSNLGVAPTENSNNNNNNNNNHHHHHHNNNNDLFINTPFFTKLKANFVKSYVEMDEELEGETKIDTQCSGTTAVTVLKQGEHLIIGNLGDSRAIICTRDDNTGQLVPEQLTIDLKPNLPSEFERIKNCNGRVIAMEEEPNVYRLWMPDDNGPGLAMARAFGDFCLKTYGLTSVPELYYRRLTDNDEFIVLATDGIWDVLSNNEVIKVVCSAKKRSSAAKVLVERAVRAWKYRYPCAKIDDCAAICLFLKRQQQPGQGGTLSKSTSESTDVSLNYSAKTDDGLDTVVNCRVKEDGEDSSADRDQSPAINARRRRPNPIMHNIH